MAVGPILTRKFNDYMRRRVERAFDIAEQQYQNDPLVPLDTGKLQGGVEIINRFVAAPRYRGILRSRAQSDSGADYAAILEAAPRIAPKRAKYLRFEVGGQTVFSKGFDNTHYRWFTKLTTKRPSVWHNALVEAGSEVTY